MPTLNAASKLREVVLKQEGTILLYSSGQVDRVIRVLPMPITSAEVEDFNRKEQNLPCVVLNLDNGPQNELWKRVERDILLKSRRDRPVASPSPVSADPKEDWSLAPEDVPVVYLDGRDEPKTDFSVPKDAPKSEFHKCDTCGKVFTKIRGLNMHSRRAH